MNYTKLRHLTDKASSFKVNMEFRTELITELRIATYHPYVSVWVKDSLNSTTVTFAGFGTRTLLSTKLDNHFKDHYNPTLLELEEFELETGYHYFLDQQGNLINPISGEIRGHNNEHG